MPRARYRFVTVRPGGLAQSLLCLATGAHSLFFSVETFATRLVMQMYFPGVIL